MNENRATRLHVSRRRFLHTGLGGISAGIAFPAIVPASSLGRGGAVAPSNRVTLGVIGTGNQGFNDLRSFLERPAGSDRGRLRCEPREPPGIGMERSAVANRRSVWWTRSTPRTSPRAFIAAARRMSISARSWGEKISTPSRSRTPDHWHAIPVMEACLAGEGHLLPEAAVADGGRGPRHELRGQQVPRRLPDGKPAAVRPSLPPRLRVGAQRPDWGSQEGPGGPSRRTYRLREMR